MRRLQRMGTMILLAGSVPTHPVSWIVPLSWLKAKITIYPETGMNGPAPRYRIAINWLYIEVKSYP